MPLDYHEPRESLPERTIDQNRALSSLIEELEAVAWYQQRADVAQDAELKAILEHNRDEEIEHAMMILEWLRRNFPNFQSQMQTYLFTNAPITQIEDEETGADGDAAEGSSRPASSTGSLNIGSMRKGG